MDEGKEAAIEAEVRAARERALVPLEIRVKSFKEMLKEKDVSFFIFLFFWFLLINLLLCRSQLLVHGKRNFTKLYLIQGIFY